MTGVFNIAAVRSWLSVFPVITEKHMPAQSWLCAWSVQTCASVPAVNMQREIPPVVYQIEACFPLE